MRNKSRGRPSPAEWRGVGGVGRGLLCSVSSGCWRSLSKNWPSTSIEYSSWAYMLAARRASRQLRSMSHSGCPSAYVYHTTISSTFLAAYLSIYTRKICSRPPRFMSSSDTLMLPTGFQFIRRVGSQFIIALYAEEDKQYLSSISYKSLNII